MSSYFEEQRDALLGEICLNMESVLTNLTTLNQSLEGVVAVGKEFESVSKLWNNFYSDLNQPQIGQSESVKEDEE